jgi:hypothetical protein
VRALRDILHSMSLDKWIKLDFNNDFDLLLNPVNKLGCWHYLSSWAGKDKVRDW